MVSGLLIGSALSIVYYLNVANGTHWECTVNLLLISMLSMVLIESIFSIVYLSPLCQWFSSGVSCQSSIYLHGVTATHMECLVNRLIISMLSMVFNGSVLSIVYLSSWCHGFSLGVSCQSSNYIDGVIGTHWECFVNRLFISMMSIVLIVNRLIIFMVSRLLIGSVLSIFLLSLWCQWYTLECRGNRLLSPWCHGYSL